MSMFDSLHSMQYFDDQGLNSLLEVAKSLKEEGLKVFPERNAKALCDEHFQTYSLDLKDQFTMVLLSI